MTNREWLLGNANAPIRYNLTHDQSLVDSLLSNDEVSVWLGSMGIEVMRQ